MTETNTADPQVRSTWFLRWFDVAQPAPRFRLIALVEAITWALLIIGMGFKYGADIDSATMVPGMLHGIAFMLYLGITGWTAVELGWSRKVTVLALLASIPPFFTLLFEWWAQRKGYLDQTPISAADGYEKISE
ncbi:hypothetical protein GOHSU_44_00200 [Gordonia hirsuta DSM 44140 = NBRC 16056]|uniref:DUF3817 domain-containing protein n=1 Tax=Gordonia hirsuta DSM 44140 = NBRC 16056 TaxID=1121927 RepID=L7LBW6_9ACTN|nr:DUF3817 domain-containing protein [Gordonia hirsuta]GAC58620.1 hypothetical protein GOHSU_44_00200 [Gordonia hirsuta DSM 44140 = NBRC 16056]